MKEKAWHSMRIEEVVSRLDTDPSHGLSRGEAERRLGEVGPNEIESVRRRSPARMLLDQFLNFLILILIGASIVSLLLGEVMDALAIISIVVLMGILGFVQEYRAEKSLEALKALATPKAKVVREGEVVELDSRLVVPGDIIVLEAGDRVPADARLISSTDLYVDESTLTGESVPVEKDASKVFDEKTPIAERRNMVFMGTYVIRGSARAVVVATGMRSEVGRIARLVQEAGEVKTPLQRQLEILGKRIGIIILGIIGVVFAVGLIFRSEDPLRLFITSVALAVAAIPEGLPAIVTIILAVGVWRMAKKNAIVRRLSSVETLGAATVICTDKTGTLTKNEMTVRTIVLPGGDTIEVTGVGYSTEGSLLLKGREVGLEDLKERNDLRRLLECFILCNNASVSKRSEKRMVGDPLELALLVAAAKAGLSVEKVREENPRILEVPFTSQRKMMSTLNRVEERTILYSKGAPEVIIGKCSHIQTSRGIQSLDEQAKSRILSTVEEMASSALRVIAFAYREVDGYRVEDGESLEENLVFLGLAGLIDPPREGVAEAVKKAQEAGIKVIMITGDHKRTAMAIAREIGIETEGRLVLTGEDLERMSFDELVDVVEDVAVFARVNPEHKADIVKALKAKGHIVAMTGDGVNDAPALKLADIGVAMGMRGTDVAREASDIILADDNFTTIVAAVEEGRIIYDNIRKPVNYLLSCNMGEVSAIFLGEMLGYGLIMEPIQILWMNLVTDALPAVGLGLEPAEPDVMKRPPRDPKEKIISRRTVRYFTYIGGVAGVLALLAYSLLLGETRNVLYAETAAFTTLVLFQLLHSMNVRSLRISLFKLGLLTNRRLLAFILIGLLLQMFAVYIATPIFHTTPLDVWHLLLLAAIALIVIPLEEIRKRLRVSVT